MASPQVENGYTKISNELLKALARINFNAYQRRVFDVILYKTYGFNKKSDWISISQITELTGIHKAHVSRAIKELKLRKIVTSSGTPPASSGNKTLSIQKDYEKWQELPRQAPPPNQVTGVTSSGNKSLPRQAYTKEKKENTTKERYTPAFLQFWKSYPKKTKKLLAFKAWKKENGNRPDIEVILKAIDDQKQWRRKQDSYNRFCPEWQDPERWIKNHRWEDELDGDEEISGGNVNEFLRGMGQENNGRYH